MQVIYITKDNIRVFKKHKLVTDLQIKYFSYLHNKIKVWEWKHRTILLLKEYKIYHHWKLRWKKLIKT